MKITEIIDYLEKYKSLVGLDQYKVLVDKSYTETDGLACVDPDILNKVLKFSLSKEFKVKPEQEQKSILVHELVHGRLAVFNEERDKTIEYLEESYCNDLERGIYKLINEVESNE